MIPAVIFVLALASSTLALPLTTQEQTQIHTELPTPQFVEKTGVEQISSTSGQQIQQISPLKVENVPVNVDKPQPAYTEAPVLLPIQPLSVLPVTQGNQVFRPVIVPAEAITAGRVIIAGLTSVQQRNFPDEIASVETQVPYQPVAQPGNYVPVQTQGYEPNQQPYYVQPVEKQTPVQQEFVQTSQGYVPVQVQYNQEQLIREQAVPVSQVSQQTVENYKPVEQIPQVYSVPQVGSEVVEKQGYQSYTPTHTAQQNNEKQGLYSQGSGYGPAQTQSEPLTQVYSGQPIVAENVEKQATQQQQQQFIAPQTTQQHGEYQPNYSPARNQPIEHQVEHVQQPYEKQEQYQQVYTPVQAQSVEQQVPFEQQVQKVQPVENVYQQQVYNNQPAAQVQPVQNYYPVEQQVYNVKPVEQVESQVSQQQVAQPQSVAYVPEQAPKSTAGEQQEVYNVQQQQVVEHAYNFGEKLPQQNPHVQILSGVPQYTSVKGTTQE